MNFTLNGIVCVVIFLISYMAFGNNATRERLLHWPYIEKRENQYYRWLTGALVHGNWTHLLVNLFVLYFFGNAVEARYNMIFGNGTGSIYYMFLMVVCAIVASMPTYINHKDNPSFRSLGASGITSGVLFAFIIFDPWQLLYLYFIIPIPGILAAVGFIFYSSYMAKKNRDNIDHVAHMYGALAGFVFTLAMKPELFNFFLKQLGNPSF